MLKKVVILSLCLICLQVQTFSQTQKPKPPRIRSISLRDVGRYANTYTPHTLRISNLLLEDVRKLRDNWDEYALQLFDARAGFRRGTKSGNDTFDTYDFLILVDSQLGEPLIEQREKWVNRRVTVYLWIRDMAITTNLYVGYVAKIELLDEKGKVIGTLVSWRWP